METIRDRNGHIIGYIDRETLSNAIVARNRQGFIVAYYDIPTNTTRTANGFIVNYGNTIGAYIVPER